MTLQAQLESQGIRVNDVCLSGIDTPLMKRASSLGAVVSPSVPSDGECLVWTSASSRWEPKACAKVTQSLQWHFADTPTTGTQPMTLLIPEGVATRMNLPPE